MPVDISRRAEGGIILRVPTLPPLPVRVAMAGRNHLKEEITHLLPTGIASDVADVNSPYEQKC